jgi:hypothetical protein
MICKFGMFIFGGKDECACEEFVIFIEGARKARQLNGLRKNSCFWREIGGKIPSGAEAQVGNCRVYVRAKRAAEKVLASKDFPPKHPSAAKAEADSTQLAARLKSCPFKALSFFRNL